VTPVMNEDKEILDQFRQSNMNCDEAEFWHQKFQQYDLDIKDEREFKVENKKIVKTVGNKRKLK
jgi:hypothetical protein